MAIFNFFKLKVTQYSPILLLLYSILGFYASHLICFYTLSLIKVQNRAKCLMIKLHIRTYIFIYLDVMLIYSTFLRALILRLALIGLSLFPLIAYHRSCFNINFLCY